MQMTATISGYLVGPIWWPTGAECYKHATHNVCDYDARCSEPCTLREHVLAMTRDGDFQSCELADATLTITVYKENRRRSRDFPLEMFPSIADCIKTDWCGPDFDD